MHSRKRGGFLPLSTIIDMGSSIGEIASGANEIYNAAKYDDKKNIGNTYLQMVKNTELTNKLLEYKAREQAAENAVNKMKEIVSGKGIEIY